MKAETAHCSPGAGTASIQDGSECTGGILNHLCAMSFSNFENAGHVRHPAERMDRQHYLYTRSSPKCSVKTFRIHVKRRRVDLDENDFCATKGDSIGCGWPRIGGHRNSVTRPHTDR
jgi:hypothetical protein